MASAQPAPAWCHLHTDILAMIFGRLRLRPRVQIVSLVCQRWREAVLRSVTSIECDAPVKLFTLPSLTQINMPPFVVGTHRFPSQLRAPPASLRSLHLRRNQQSTTCGCHFLRALTGLTRLDVEISAGANCCEEWLQLLLRNTASLTEVSLDLFVAMTPVATMQALGSLHLPALRSLTLVTSKHTAINQLLITHASQLVHIKLPFGTPLSFGQDWLSSPLLKCRSLDFWLPLGSQLATLASLADVTPSLTEMALAFNVDANSGEFPVSRFPFSALTALSYGTFNATASLEWLARCTALRKLQAFDSSRGLRHLPALPGLRKLEMPASVELLQDLQCRQLTLLRAEADVLPMMSSRGWSFACLRKLHIRAATVADVKCLHRVASVARLRFVHVGCDYVNYPNTVPTCELLPGLLRHLHSCNVEEVEIYFAHGTKPPAHLADAAKAYAPWMQVHILAD